jgi:DNA-binding NtrC family response regulator
LSTVRRVSPNTQVILMTAYGTSDVIDDAHDLGAYCVLPKPLEMTSLSDLIVKAHAAAV